MHIFVKDAKKDCISMGFLVLGVGFIVDNVTRIVGSVVNVMRVLWCKMGIVLNVKGRVVRVGWC